MTDTTNDRKSDSIFAVSIASYVSNLLNNILADYAKSKGGERKVNRLEEQNLAGDSTYRFIDAETQEPIVGVCYTNSGKTFLLI